MHLINKRTRTFRMKYITSVVSLIVLFVSTNAYEAHANDENMLTEDKAVINQQQEQSKPSNDKQNQDTSDTTKPDKPNNDVDKSEDNTDTNKPKPSDKPDETEKPGDTNKPDTPKPSEKPSEQPKAPSTSDGTNTYYPQNRGNTTGQQTQQQTTSDQAYGTTWQQQVPKQYHHLFKDAFKYNPYVMQQFQNLPQGDLDEQNINNVLEPEHFDNYRFLSALQQNTNYFKFQNFNPLQSDDYYKNLDKQVLGLVASDLGSMPDLKQTNRKVAYHDDTVKKKQIKQAPEDKKDSQMMREHTTSPIVKTLTALIMVIFLSVVFMYMYQEGRKQKVEE